MSYAEMQKIEAEYLKATEPKKVRKQRGATREQLEYRAKIRHAKALCVVCGTPFGMHTSEMSYFCAMQRS